MPDLGPPVLLPHFRRSFMGNQIQIREGRMKNVAFLALHRAIKSRGLEVMEVHEDEEHEFAASYFHKGETDDLYISITPDFRVDTYSIIVSYLKNYEEDDTPLGTFRRYFHSLTPALAALWVNGVVDQVLSGKLAKNLEDQFN